MEKVIVTFEISSLFGFLRKPELNEDIYFSYNTLHKPALLGILGSILGLRGLEGYNTKDDYPEYYTLLSNIPLGIQPITQFSGVFDKTIIEYTNTIGYANAGSTLMVKEQTLIRPHFKIYLLLDTNVEIQIKLKTFLEQSEAVFLPYFGKNEHNVIIKNFKVLQLLKDNIPVEDFFLSSIFIKSDLIKDMIKFEAGAKSSKNKFLYFEELPVGYDVKSKNYAFEKFVYSNYKFKKHFNPGRMYKIGENEFIQMN